MSCVDQGAFRLIGAACKQARQAAVDGSIESERVSSTETGLSVDMSLGGSFEAENFSCSQLVIHSIHHSGPLSEFVNCRVKDILSAWVFGLEFWAFTQLTTHGVIQRIKREKNLLRRGSMCVVFV